MCMFHTQLQNHKWSSMCNYMNVIKNIVNFDNDNAMIAPLLVIFG